MECKATKENSPLYKRRANRTAGLAISLLLVLGMLTPLHAQMFSVGSEGPRFNTPQTEFNIGLEPMTSEYKGGAVQQNGAGAFTFEGSIIRLRYNSPFFDFFMGTGGEVTNIDEASYFDVGGNIDFGINIVRSKPVSVLLPIQIASRYTNITNDRALSIPTLNRFQFGSLTAGAGAKVLLRPKNNLRIELGAIPSYGFSFASGGFFGGSLGSMTASGRLYFDRLFGDIGLSAGYIYDLRNYDIDEDTYDYKITGHSLELGITF